MTYRAPVKDMLFVMKELAGIDELTKLPAFEDAGYDTAQAVLEECAKFNEDVVAPLNVEGDRNPSYFKDGNVISTPGFKEAFKQFGEGGWQGLQHPTDFGGQGLPKLIGAACGEMINSANVSFALCPLLTDGAIEALLTAGSDLAAVRTRAVPQDDGTFKVFGTKIFITYGEHDMAENIVHLVLARTPTAPEGVKGISLFVVPKFLVNADGSLGARNDVHCVSIEHKMGIKASPTAVLQFGDHGGAIGTLVGEENRGLEYMFIMMNAARFGVGLQGIGLSENAYQQAVAFAKDRVQSRDLAGSAGPVSIIHHPDVRRLLMNMRSQTEAARALAYVGASLYDAAHHHADAATRAENQAVYEYLVPIIKGWSTELSQDVTRDGVQVHGGMGFIEETGAAQHYRDAKILTIYEGTTAIQANDLVGRKTVRDGGRVAKGLIAQVRATEAELAKLDGAEFAAIRKHLAQGAADLEAVVEYVAGNMKSDIKAVFAGSVNYLKLAGIVLGGWQMARAAVISQQKLKAGDGDASFYQAKIVTARFFADHFLTQSGGLRASIIDGSAGVLALSVEQF